MVYFDNAATMRRSRAVLDAVREFYEKVDASPLRGLYEASVEATRLVEQGRETAAGFIGARAEQIVFTRGATGGLNMTKGLLRGSGDSAILGDSSEILGDSSEILVSKGEHHSNLLPWAELARETGARLRLIEVLRDGTVDFRDFERKLSARTKIVAVGVQGNVLGGVNPVGKIAKKAHETGAIVVADAAQAVAHEKIDVEALGADFLAFSGHKIGAPTGVGVLYIREPERWRPAEWGGEMVDGVSVTGDGGIETALAEGPRRFEAGTVNTGGIVGMTKAIETLKFPDARVFSRLFRGLSEVRRIEVIGGANGIVSFKVKGVHAHDVAQILAEEGISVRAGYHCAEPLLTALGAGPVVRASLAYYNTEAEVERFLEVVSTVGRRMGV